MSSSVPFLVVIVGLVAVLFLRERDRDAENARLRSEWSDDRSILLRELASARTEHAGMIADLCQRIQAPDVAVVDHAVMSHESPQAVSADLDTDFWEARLTKEQLAEALAEAEMTA